MRPLIERFAASLPEVEILVYEPTEKYQNMAKRQGAQKLTPARALIAEAVRRYWVLGIECTLLEIQKLAWFLSRSLARKGLPDVLDLHFEANRYGPYSRRLNHLLNALDGSYLRAAKRVADCTPYDTIGFADERRGDLDDYLRSAEMRLYGPVLDEVDALIDGFQSPYGLELLASVDWLLTHEQVEPEVSAVRQALAHWPGGRAAAERKLRLFANRDLELALSRLERWQN